MRFRLFRYACALIEAYSHGVRQRRAFAVGAALLDAYPVHRVLTGKGFWGGPESAVWLLLAVFVRPLLAWRLNRGPGLG